MSFQVTSSRVNSPVAAQAPLIPRGYPQGRPKSSKSPGGAPRCAPGGAPRTQVSEIFAKSCTLG